MAGSRASSVIGSGGAELGGPAGGDDHPAVRGQHRDRQRHRRPPPAFDVQRLDDVDNPFRGSAVAAEVAAGPAGGTRDRPGRRISTPGARPPPPPPPARTVARSRSGSTFGDEQLRAPGLGVPAALPDLHPLGPGGSGAGLHPVGVKDRDRVARRLSRPAGRRRPPASPGTRPPACGSAARSLRRHRNAPAPPWPSRPLPCSLPHPPCFLHRSNLCSRT